MTMQLGFILFLTTLAGAYLARGLFRSACGSGCGACKAKGCPSRKLQTVRAKAEHSRH